VKINEVVTEDKVEEGKLGALAGGAAGFAMGGIPGALGGAAVGGYAGDKLSKLAKDKYEKFKQYRQDKKINDLTNADVAKGQKWQDAYGEDPQGTGQPGPKRQQEINRVSQMLKQSNPVAVQNRLQSEGVPQSEIYSIIQAAQGEEIQTPSTPSQEPAPSDQTPSQQTAPSQQTPSTAGLPSEFQVINDEPLVVQHGKKRYHINSKDQWAFFGSEKPVDPTTAALLDKAVKPEEPVSATTAPAAPKSPEQIRKEKQAKAAAAIQAQMRAAPAQPKPAAQPQVWRRGQSQVTEEIDLAEVLWNKMKSDE